MNKKRIGILGGTFNPVHNGHIHLASHVLRKFRLNRVIFVPAYMPPHKRIRGNATAADRLRMLRLALRGYRKFSVSGYEMRKKGKSYSVNTVKHFRRKYGKGSALYFIIGADSASGLVKWRDIQRLFRLAQFVVLPRPGFKAGRAPRAVLRANMPGRDISSTKVRSLVKRGKPVSRLVPKAVLRYIRSRRLYL